MEEEQAMNNEDNRSEDGSQGGLSVGQYAAQHQRTLLELNASFDIDSHPFSVRKTGIVCTIGPACQEVDKLVELMRAGLCIARLNFSHGTHDYHEGSIKNIRKATDMVKRPIAIALDTKGPEIRTGELDGFQQNKLISIKLVDGAFIELTSDKAFETKCTADKLYVDYTNLWKVVNPGFLVYVDDGLISLEVIEARPGSVQCRVKEGGELGSRKGVNLPHSKVDLPALSERDIGDLKFGVEQQVDIIFASFIRKKEDVLHIRETLSEKGKYIKIISKIENHEGVDNFDEILEVSDGIMVARGDLGIEIPAEKVFLAQKMMIAKCNMNAKPVICATQMLETMITNPRPTRAESTDVANAVIDGSDCVMLSGETAKGKYPVHCVKMMARICMEAECAIFYTQYREELRKISMFKNTSATEACAIAAVDASLSQNADGIICLSLTGRTARYLAKWRPRCPILGVTRNPACARQMHLLRGVYPLLFPVTIGHEDAWTQDVDNRFYWAIQQGKEMGMFRSGGTIIGVHGWKTGPGHTNTVRILRVS